MDKLDEKILMLLHYERLQFKMGKVEPEFESVLDLNQAFGKR